MTSTYADCWVSPKRKYVMSLLTYRNTQEEFIGKHIQATLQTDGYETSDINRGIQEALRFYRTTCTFTKGRVFDSCLTKARNLLKPIKKAKKKGKAA